MIRKSAKGVFFTTLCASLTLGIKRYGLTKDSKENHRGFPRVSATGDIIIRVFERTTLFWIV